MMANKRNKAQTRLLGIPAAHQILISVACSLVGLLLVLVSAETYESILMSAVMIELLGGTFLLHAWRLAGPVGKCALLLSGFIALLVLVDATVRLVFLVRLIDVIYGPGTGT
jgi:hypothetical protein